MNLKLSTWLPLALVAAALITGCGSASESTTKTPTVTVLSRTPTATATAPAKTTPPTTTTPATTSSSTAKPTPPATTTGTPTTGTTNAKTAPTSIPQPQKKLSGQQAADVCKGAVQAEPTISASTKARLEKSCESAAGAGPAALRKVAQQVCVEIINATHVPAGAARERALSVCSDE